MKRWLAVVGFVLLLVLASGCAAGVNEHLGVANAEGVVSGFWRGLWHGCIAPMAFIVSLFNRDIQVYEIHNNGGWYNAGFLLGMSIVFGGGGHGSGRQARRGK